MISDLRVIDEPLAKSICRTCGVVHRRAILPAGLFTTGYSLYAHSPGAPREAKRQDGYASWIAGQLATPPATVLDVGCGNGSLLLALERLWPQAVTRGIDPSPHSIQFARAAGVDARARALGEPSNEQTEPANLVVSVNVIEHTRAPRSFVRDAAKLTAANGELIVICPNGRTPWSELLIVDHRWSLAPTHLSTLFESEGLTVRSVSTSAAELGSFLLIRGGRDGAGRRSPSANGEATTEHAADKDRYLKAWRDLDGRLEERTPAGPLVCFGIGEAAGLLRAYAPRTWSRVERCVADDPESDAFGTLPVDEYRRVVTPMTLLLGVRPPSQTAVAARLRADGHVPITWHDLVAP